MSCDVTKLNYLKETKNLIKAALIDKGASITDETPFRDYAAAVEGISSGGTGITPIGTDGRPTGAVTVPEGVETLYQYLFRDDTAVTSINFPTTLTEIPNNACNGCTALNAVDIKSDITNIGSSAFYGCDLNSISIPNGVTTIGGNAFANNVNLTDVEINFTSDLTTISASAFGTCRKLSKVRISPAVTFIGDAAFINCDLSGLIIDTDIKVSDNLYQANGSNINIASRAFLNTKITKAQHDAIIARATKIGGAVFQNCTNIIGVIKSADFGITDSTSGYGAHYRGCTGITKLIIPYISGTAKETCYGCTALEEVAINGAETLSSGYSISFQKAFYNCTALKKVTLPAIVENAQNLDFGYATTNSNYAFYGCTALENVVIGAGWDAWLNLSVSENLTVDCMVNILNNLKDNSSATTKKTVTFGAVNLAKLTDEQIAIGTAKNWTIA